jgi:hypothetical protein
MELPVWNTLLRPRVKTLTAAPQPRRTALTGIAILQNDDCQQMTVSSHVTDHSAKDYR